jgi:iron(III) transport system substrate-binding protein
MKRPPTRLTRRQTTATTTIQVNEAIGGMMNGWSDLGRRWVVVGAWLTGCIVAVASMPACTQAGDTDVVLYVSADEYVAREVVDAFEDDTGINVRVVGDTEAKKTTGLVERLRDEADNPQADVFWSSEVFLTIALADEGVLAPYESPATADWPAQFRDRENRWYGFAGRARVIVYHTDRVAVHELPETWTDLDNPPYEGRVVMADPRFGTTGGHLGAMKAYWDRNVAAGYYEAYLMGLRDNGVRMLPSGNAGVVRAIVAGEADFGMTDTDDVWAAQAQGQPVDLIYPQHNHGEEEGNGTLLIPNTVARVKGAPNPEAAGRLIDYLLSEKVERLLAESVSHNVPLRPGLAAEYPDLAVGDPLDVNYRRAAAERAEAVAMAMRIIAQAEEPAEAATDEPREEPGNEPSDAR